MPNNNKKNQKPPVSPQNKEGSNNSNKAEHPSIQAVRQEFYHRYGGAPAAQALFERGIHSFGDSLPHTAARLLRARASKKQLVLSFAGYSVTVGRGNHLSESYPLVLREILRPVLQQTLQLDLIVRNAAIGGIPSFPYGFCFEHFLGADADFVSWDYSMNEQKGDAAVLESYLRQSQNQLSNRPMVMVLDTNKQRCRLLRDYAEQGLIREGLCVGRAKDAVPQLQEILQSEPLPPGFTDWDEFGAGPSCPGRGSWHPKKKEHELIGWMLAMYFVEAAALAEKMLLDETTWQSDDDDPPLLFPAPLVPPPDNPSAVTELLYGPGPGQPMKQLSCRTNFLPATDADKVLPSIVVAGLAPGVSSDNIMEPRSDETYATGWVLDVSTVERETKVKVEKCGGLGYIDMKIALYGIPDSGTLKLWLPVEDDRHDGNHEEGEEAAPHWFDELIVCEANEKRPDGACHLDTDVEYTVGGVRVESPQMVSGAAEYLKRKTCVHVGIPEGARITRLGDLHGGTTDESSEVVLSAEAKQRLSRGGALRDTHVGLVVELKAREKVERAQGACCVSHVVWAQH